MIDNLPNVAEELFARSIPTNLGLAEGEHKPRILLLYGSNRERSYSRLLTQEAARLLEAFGAETRIFDPSGLPMPDDADSSHPKVKELIDLVLWSEGQVWCSPERHGAMTGVFKSQIDWIPLTMGPHLFVPPHAGRRLAPGRWIDRHRRRLIREANMPAEWAAARAQQPRWQQRSPPS